MGKETFQGGNEIICYDIAPPLPPLRPSDLKLDLTCWRKLHSAETAQFNTTSIFFYFPRFCCSPMQDCVRAWVTALKVPSVQVNGITNETRQLL